MDNNKIDLSNALERIRELSKPQQFTIDYEKELNESQLKAVNSIDGTFLVIAGAGSGKTRTLVYRVAKLIELGNDPQSIVLLTFTRKSAEEMMTRASRILDDRCSKINGGTFHSFANLTLRKYAHAVGLPNNFTIMDQGDAEDLISMIRTDLGYNKKDKRFPNKGVINAIISLSVNKEISIPDILESDYPQYMQYAGDLVDIYNHYVSYKTKNFTLDFDDLLIYLKMFLQEGSSYAINFVKNINYVMVDEFQDTNKLQGEIVKGLAQLNNNVMVVGDECQSIYAFRGANFKNIITFPELFEKCEIIYLVENYRSTPEILNMANIVIEKAREKFPKKLLSRCDIGILPSVVSTRDENLQTKFIVKSILKLRDEGVKLSDIAVLFRSSFHSFDLEVGLQAANIPYIKYGGMKFVESAHIKDILAFLRVVANPRDFISWMRILLLHDGIGAKTAQKIVREITSGNVNLENPMEGMRLGKGALSGLFEVYRQIIEDSFSIMQKLEMVIGYYMPFFKEKYDDYAKRTKDLDVLINLSSKYRSLDSFLNDMALDPPRDSVVGTEASNKDSECLNLSTIHSAKGLEWHTVFLLNVLEGYFPSSQSTETIEGIEEERRLMYVAVTRAKKNLFISYPSRIFSRYEGYTFGKQSRFIEEIQAEGVMNRFYLDN